MTWLAHRLLIAAAAFAVSHGERDMEREFVRFVEEFGKKYEDAREREVRFLTFVRNYMYILAENAKGHSYTLGVNKFTDMTPEEFSLTQGGLRPRSEPWGGLPRLGTHAPANETLPKSVDWRAKGAVTPVKNQAQCGSCWAFSTTGAVEGAWQIATGDLVSLSEQQLVDCSTKFGNQGCNGGEMDGAFSYAETASLCTEASYPYAAKNGICKAPTCSTGIPKGGVVGYKDVPEGDMHALMDAVSQQPVAVAIEADKMAFQLYKSGVLSAPCGDTLDHGVLAVGYGTTEDGHDYWIVKNSWGSNWGMDGYVLLKRGAPGGGECGIKKQPSYPVVTGSAPPSPSPSPPPPPPPAQSHYEQPPCQDDEVQAEVQGASGSVCAPHCDNSPCPTDTPHGTKAKPQCLLQDSQTGSKYCALVCMRSSSCPTGAKCSILGFSGICVYPEASAVGPRLSLQRLESEGGTLLNV